MNINEINEIANRAKMVQEENNRALFEDKIVRIREAIIRKVNDKATGWLVTYPWLQDDVEEFLNEATDDFLAKGMGVFFGKTGYNSHKVRDFGPYILSIEDALEGAHYPYVLKVNVRAGHKLCRLLTNRLKLEEEISVKAANEILSAVLADKFTIQFVSFPEFKEMTSECENDPIVLKEFTGIVGRDTMIDCVAVGTVVGDELLVTRTDWWSDDYLPEKVEYNLRYVKQRT